MRTMSRAYQITGTVFFLFSAYIAKESLELKFYTSLGPGPGFFPFWLAVIMGALSAMMVFNATFRTPDPMPSDFFASKSGYLKFLAVCGAQLWVVFTMVSLGYRLSMLAFFIFLMATLGRMNPLLNLVIAFVAAFGSFHLFDQMLKVPLPQGMFGF